MRAYLVISSDHEQNISVAKKDIKKTAEYFLPMIISVLSILFLVGYLMGDPNKIINTSEIIQFQIDNQITAFGITVPALFLFINPFAFIAFVFSVIGYLRETNLDISEDEEQMRYWNPEKEFTGRRQFLILAGKCVELVLLISLPISLFIASGQLTDNIIWNNLLYYLLLFGMLIIIASIGRGKPRTWIDRKMLFFIRTPLFISLLGLALTFLIIYVDIPIADFVL
jgi:NADH:ubiquinone oxidoreductase subunit H